MDGPWTNDEWANTQSLMHLLTRLVSVQEREFHNSSSDFSDKRRLSGSGVGSSGGGLVARLLNRSGSWWVSVKCGGGWRNNWSPLLSRMVRGGAVPRVIC